MSKTEVLAFLKKHPGKQYTRLDISLAIQANAEIIMDIIGEGVA